MAIVEEAAATYSIAEVAEQLNVSAHTLRYYEQIGLVRVARNRSGYRAYDDANLARLRFVTYLRATHYPSPTCGGTANCTRRARSDRLQDRGPGDDVVPIPGTKRVARVEENAGAAQLSLTDADLARLDDLRPVGARHTDMSFVRGDSAPAPS